MKFALVGGENLKKYTIANILWKQISELSGLNFDFEIRELATLKEVYAYYWEFLETDELVGFNIALPWKELFLELIKGNDSFFLPINTVYKRGKRIMVENTDVLAVDKSLSALIDLNKSKILILGCGGVGFATAKFLHNKYSAKVYCFDIDPLIAPPLSCVQMGSYHDIRSRKYDVIINATEVGKYYLNSQPKMFSTPLDYDILKAISHKDSILQEMNYLPSKTLFLQIGETLKLKTVGGNEMLVLQALQSFTNYTGIILSGKETKSLINYIKHYSNEKASQLISNSF